MLFYGDINASILFITDYQRIHCQAEGRVISKVLCQPLVNALKKVGLRESQYAFLCVYDNASCKLTEEQHNQFKEKLSQCQATVLVPLGSICLELLTGNDSIAKWQNSIIEAKAEYGSRKCLPLYHPEHVQKFYGDHIFYSFAAAKLKQEHCLAAIATPKRKFLLDPPLEQALSYLKNKVLRAEAIGVDFEFSLGQINTVGFSVSGLEAIAIKTVQNDYSEVDYHRLWLAIAEVLESNVPKYIQHAAVEVTWAARYGIQLKNVAHDTMWAMKFLYPELDKGLDNVGRVFTPFSYWKDDRDDWSNIKNWQRHLSYNCCDTTVTYWAAKAQQRALKERRLDKLFYSFVMAFQPIIQEMCVEGLNVKPSSVLALKEKIETEQQNYQRIIDQECEHLLGKTINVRSPKQLKEALTTMGMKLPMAKKKGQSEASTTTDKKALVKLRRQYPDNIVIPALIGISAANKKLSGYINFEYERDTNKVHYTLDGCGTETGRWAGFQSSWGTGFNPQTVPKFARVCFVASPGKILVQIDLKQAESRYVAWDGPDVDMMHLLSTGQDIHRYVASKIFNKNEALLTDLQRQLGKKAGHASNYGTGERTFAEMCLVEMNHFLEVSEARQILTRYMATFPGVRKRQEAIKNELYRKRMLRTPMGRERYFFGRMDDGTFREAFAYCPQSTIPDITNCLMLALWKDRDYLGLSYEDGGRFLLQVHDSLLLQADPQRVGEIAEFCRDTKLWHPKITLAGGDLIIPTDVEMGYNWKDMKKLP